MNDDFFYGIPAAAMMMMTMMMMIFRLNFTYLDLSDAFLQS
jgi:hypothetical protein